RLTLSPSRSPFLEWFARDVLAAVGSDQGLDGLGVDVPREESGRAVGEAGAEPRAERAAQLRQWPLDVEGQVLGLGPGDRSARLDDAEGRRRPVLDGGELRPVVVPE